jgi:transposase-like protein
MLTAEKHLRQILDEVGKTNGLLGRVVELLEREDSGGVRCPDCGSDDMDDKDSTMGHPRLTCNKCGRSWEVESG